MRAKRQKISGMHPARGENKARRLAVEAGLRAVFALSFGLFRCALELHDILPRPGKNEREDSISNSDDGYRAGYGEHVSHDSFGGEHF